MPDALGFILKALLQHRANQLKEKEWMISEEVFYPVDRHVLLVVRGTKSTTDKVAGAVLCDHMEELREVQVIEFVVLDQVSRLLGSRLAHKLPDNSASDFWMTV